jgi:hypothetical protein
MTYEERNTRFDDRGHWQLGADGKILILHGGGGAQQEFAVPDGDALRQLDSAGHEIVSKLNYDLKRAPTFTVIETGSEETANASLENTDWTLILVGDSGVNLAPQKVPHLVLNSNDEKSERVRRLQSTGGQLHVRWRSSLFSPDCWHHDGLSGRHGDREGISASLAASKQLEDQWATPGFV